MILRGSCHCGATRFQVTEVPRAVTRCTCSICTKRGALWAYYAPEQFSLLTPTESTATDRWEAEGVSLNSCPKCGCGTFTEMPDWVDGEPDFDHPRIAVNARLFDAFDLAAIPVTVVDGKSLW